MLRSPKSQTKTPYQKAGVARFPHRTLTMCLFISFKEGSGISETPWGVSDSGWTIGRLTTCLMQLGDLPSRLMLRPPLPCLTIQRCPHECPIRITIVGRVLWINDRRPHDGPPAFKRRSRPAFDKGEGAMNCTNGERRGRFDGLYRSRRRVINKKKEEREVLLVWTTTTRNGVAMGEGSESVC